MLKKSLKPKKCRACRAEFTPRLPMARACSIECALVLAGAARKKTEKAEKVKERGETRAKLDKLKSRAIWAREAQSAVNRYARLRDLAAGRGCITCGARPAQKVGGTMDAGHFRSVGSAPHLRFFLPQIRLQCVSCNRYQGGRALDFRRALVEQHGVAWVDELEAMQGCGKWSAEYLQRLKKIFTKKAKRMESRK